VFKTKAAQAQLVAFYNNQWLNIPFQSIDTAFVFPLTFEIADELERVGGEILGGVNRSKAFRVMVAYFAFVHKLKNQNTDYSRIASPAHLPSERAAGAFERHSCSESIAWRRAAGGPANRRCVAD